MSHKLIVIGATPAGISLAAEARRAGVEPILVIAVTPGLVPGESIARHHLQLHNGEVDRIEVGDTGAIEVVSDSQRFSSEVVAVDPSRYGRGTRLAWEVPDAIADRVHTTLDFDAAGRDVLVVASGESAAVAAWRLVGQGARVVVCFTGRLRDLSLTARQMLEELEREQRATILWRSAPDTLVDVGGFPMAVFADRRTPDLQFDHVVDLDVPEQELGFELDAEAAERLFVISEAPHTSIGSVTVTPAEAWPAVRSKAFPELPEISPHRVGEVAEAEARELATHHYNATITSFDTAHNELWRIRVRPDRAGVAHQPGQYCSLGLGYWEPRADDAVDPGLEKRRDKLIRRSYSISSPIFDQYGYLFDHSDSDEIELYIVWVQADAERVPGLTPRLALKQAGDRIYLGPKVAGRYTLAAVTDPAGPVVFCATGTGEAPHNAMIVELLRKGHYGPILSAVTVRYRSDLAYLEEHRRLQERYPNYRYVTVPTREPDVPKRYLQDLLSEGDLEKELGVPLDPERAHVFLCGNPAMIGLPEWDGDTPTFPEPTGMAELLHARGFIIDRRGVSGNVHYEEYW